jgi:alkyldihydroxyacetonephosphate synthase
MERRRKFWGWGYEDQEPPADEVAAAGAAARMHLDLPPAEVEPPVRLEDVELRAARIHPPDSLAHMCTTDRHERVTHSYGKGYRDLVRARRGRFDNPPDLVARPAEEDDVERVLAWCEEVGAAVIPFGGGTSVVGGVEPPPDRPAVSIDLGALDRVLEVDEVSRAARIQAGVLGPVLEDQLRACGYTLRHFPQSFELSSLGGWIATRAGGHFATLYTHIDDLVESIRAITPRGWWESRRLPGSGAGPSPDRLLIGSEGTLGVITEAWMRIQDAPRFRESAAVRFDSFESGARAVRALSQSGLHPSNCRLLDADEAALTGASTEGALLVLGFESADHDLGPWMERAVELCEDHGGRNGAARAGRSGAEGAWRDAFLQAPYLRDALIAAGIFVETYETAVTWDRLDALVAAVKERAHEALGNAGVVTCRLTHVYPDGAAPYFSALAPARRGDELAQWDDVKAAISDVILDGGGTITHHHAVGRDHRPWYDRQRPEPFAVALRAAKAAVDPAGILNPGVLIDPADGGPRAPA